MINLFCEMTFPHTNTITHPLESQLLGLLEFIKKYEFLYARLNIEFFSSAIYQQIDEEWLKFMVQLPTTKLNRLPYDFDQFETMECPASLRQFFEKALSHSLLDKCTQKFSLNDLELTAETRPAKMNKIKAKKMHEFGKLAQLIQAEFEKVGHVSRIVDIGSGLGHLGRYLRSSDADNIEYVGIESNAQFCHSGRKICEDIQLENVHFCAENIDKCRQILADNKHQTAIVSLHGCGELQRLILTEFALLSRSQTPNLNPLLITIGCCYHKVNDDWADDDAERWIMSETMLRLFKQVYGQQGFPVPGLRLACQAKLARWIIFTEEEHRRHQQSFSNRAFVECLKGRVEFSKHPSTANARTKKLSRKLGTSAEEFRAEVVRRSGCDPEERQRCEELLDQIVEEHSHALAFIEPFTTLQFALQAPLESLVLLDRLFFLQERGIDAELVELFDPVVSPRNICIVARRKEK